MRQREVARDLAVTLRSVAGPAAIVAIALLGFYLTVQYWPLR